MKIGDLVRESPCLNRGPIYDHPMNEYLKSPESPRPREPVLIRGVHVFWCLLTILFFVIYR